MSKTAWRYVEVAYDLPNKSAQFHAVVTEAASPREALDKAIQSVRQKHPNVLRTEEFMQRIITERRANEIMTAFDRGTWEGWEFDGEAHD